MDHGNFVFFFLFELKKKKNYQIWHSFGTHEVFFWIFFSFFQFFYFHFLFYFICCFFFVFVFCFFYWQRWATIVVRTLVGYWISLVFFEKKIVGKYTHYKIWLRKTIKLNSFGGNFNLKPRKSDSNIYSQVVELNLETYLDKSKHLMKMKNQIKEEKMKDLILKSNVLLQWNLYRWY